MRVLITLILLAAPAAAQDVGSLKVAGPPPVFETGLLGLPVFLWVAFGVFVAAAAIRFLLKSTLHTAWLADRCNEPSTYTAAAIFLAAGGLFAQSLTMDPSSAGQGLLLSATVFAFLGLIGKDKEGPLL